MRFSGFPAGTFVVARPQAHSLAIRLGPSAALARAAALTVFATLWYWLVLDMPLTLSDTSDAWTNRINEGPFSWLFLALPLLFLTVGSFPLCRILLLQERILFDAQRQQLLYGRREIPFGDLTAVQLRRIAGTEVPDQYLLSLCLCDGSKLRLIGHSSRELVLDASEQIADLLRLRIETIDS